MSNYVTEYMKAQVEEADFEYECRHFSIVDAAKGIASGRGLSGRELEINQELENRSGRELKCSTSLRTVGLNMLMLLRLLLLVAFSCNGFIG